MKKQNSDVITSLKKLAWAEKLFPNLAEYGSIIDRATRRGFYSTLGNATERNRARQGNATERKRQGYTPNSNSDPDSRKAGK